MSIRTFYLTLLIAIFSCSKDPIYEPLVGSVNFSVNGTSYDWREQHSGANYLTMNIFPSTPGIYILSITNQFSANLLPARIVNMTIQATTLNTNIPYTYTNATATDPLFPPHQIAVSNNYGYDPFNLYNGSEIGDFATVTITSIHDKMADGHFVAKLRRASDLSIVNIVDGAFKNIEIY